MRLNNLPAEVVEPRNKQSLFDSRTQLLADHTKHHIHRLKRKPLPCALRALSAATFLFVNRDRAECVAVWGLSALSFIFCPSNSKVKPLVELREWWFGRGPMVGSFGLYSPYVVLNVSVGIFWPSMLCFLHTRWEPYLGSWLSGVNNYPICGYMCSWFLHWFKQRNLFKWLMSLDIVDSWKLCLSRDWLPKQSSPLTGSFFLTFPTQTLLTTTLSLPFHSPHSCEMPPFFSLLSTSDHHFRLNLILPPAGFSCTTPHCYLFHLKLPAAFSRQSSPWQFSSCVPWQYINNGLWFFISCHIVSDYASASLYSS